MAHIVGYAQTIDPATYQQYRRMYPGEHATINDLAGRDGVELQYDPYMHGVNGTEQVEVDAGERPVRVLRSGGTVPGDSVYLTINWKLQKQVSADLQAALAKYSLRQGVAVVENVKTGEILAMVSLPSYNNNAFSPGISYAKYQALLHDPATPLNNLAISGQYPPGSTFKLVTAAAALGTGVVTPSTQYDDTGKITLPGGQIYNGWQPGGLGMMNLLSAIEESSDIYFYTVAGGNPNLHPDPPHIGGTRLAHYAHLYGLGQPTGIDLPNEQAGFIPSPHWFNHLKPYPNVKNPGDVWTIGYSYNMAIGQGQDTATPLQIANYTAMIANGGTLYEPTIVGKIEGRIVPGKSALRHSRVVQGFAPTIIRRNFLPASTVSLIRHGMYLGTHSGLTGTSYAAYDPRFTTAGKTGTAEVLGQAPHAWWTGFAPYNNPQIAVTVLVPHANAEGAELAAPIAHKIFEDYFGLSPYRNPYNIDGPPGHDGTHGQWLDDVLQQLVGGGGGSQ
jgi:penicillin-binding protein 2